MGRISQDQGQLFYSFNLEAVVPDDHLVRAIARVLDLSWDRAGVAPHYSHTGRPSIDPVLMIRMLVVGYVFAIRSERALCREVQLNLTYRWFCGLGIEDNIPDRSAFSRADLVALKEVPHRAATTGDPSLVHRGDDFIASDPVAEQSA